MTLLGELYDLLGQSILLIASQSGGLVYHLVLLFTFQTVGIFALSRWQKGTGNGRLFGAVAWLFSVRLIMVIVTLLAATPTHIVDSLIVIPPLDRAASALTVLLLIWAFVFPNPAHLADAVTAALALSILIALGLSWGGWAQDIHLAGAMQSYNGSAQESVWEIGQLLLLLSGGILLAAHRKADWSVGLGLIALLLVGHTLQLYPSFSGNVPGVVRLVDILAFPIFTILVYRRARVPLPLVPASVQNQAVNHTALSSSTVESLTSSSATTEADNKPELPESLKHGLSALLIAVILVVSWIAFLTRADQFQSDAGFSEFYLQDVNSLLRADRIEVSENQPVSVTVGIVNHEGVRSRYRIMVSINSNLLNATPEIIELENNQSVNQSAEFSLPSLGDNQRVSILLERQGSPFPYRQLNLFVDVRPSATNSFPTIVAP
jgi:uncharacterized membrane protein